MQTGHIFALFCAQVVSGGHVSAGFCAREVHFLRVGPIPVRICFPGRQEPAEAEACRSRLRQTQRQTQRQTGAGRGRGGQEQPEPVGASQGQSGPTHANICREGGGYGSEKENVAAGFSFFGFCCF